MGTALIVPSLLLLRENPESMGLLPDGVEPEAEAVCHPQTEEEQLQMTAGPQEHLSHEGEQEGVNLTVVIELQTSSEKSTEEGATPVQSEASGVDEQLKGWSRAQALGTFPFWCLTLGGVYMATASAGIFFHLASIAKDSGLESGVLAGIVLTHTTAISATVEARVTRALAVQALCSQPGQSRGASSSSSLVHLTTHTPNKHLRV